VCALRFVGTGSLGGGRLFLRDESPELIAGLYFRFQGFPLAVQKTEGPSGLPLAAPHSYHEPYYSSYIKEDFGSLASKCGLKFVRSDILPCQSHGFRQTRCVKKTSSSTRRDPIERAINTDVVGGHLLRPKQAFQFAGVVADRPHIIGSDLQQPLQILFE
jgi:hypothetical protein